MTDPRLERPPWRGRSNVDAMTIACIEHAEAIAREQSPKTAHQFDVTQGSYQDGHGDVNSAGTHDLGGVVDLKWCGHWSCLVALRMAGTTAAHRTPAQGPWVDHIHLVVIGHPLLAAAAARQVTAYLNRRNGLSNNGPDDGPRLDPIPRPVWPYPQENDVISKEDRAAIVKDLLDAPIADDGRTVRKALRQASKAAGLEDAIANKISEQIVLSGGAAPTGQQIRDAVKQALREGTGY